MRIALAENRRCYIMLFSTEIVRYAVSYTHLDVYKRQAYSASTPVIDSTTAPNAIKETVFGFLSLIFWLLIFVVSIKYLTFVMRADNAGEGGILTLSLIHILLNTLWA